MQQKKSIYSGYRADRKKIFQKRDAKIADIISKFDWTSESAKEIDEKIDKIYSEATGARNQLAEKIFGNEADSVLEYYEGIPLEDLAPQSVLRYANDRENFRNDITHKIDYDAQEALRSKAVSQLPPKERAAWLRKQYSHLGSLDEARFEAGDYKFANEFMERRERAGDDVGKWINAPKYKGLNNLEGDRVDKLLKTVSEAADILQLQTGKFFSKKKILTAINSVLPGSKIIQYALITTFTNLKPLIMSTVRFDIIYNNPDVVIFHPFTFDGFDLDQEEKDRWLDRWGAGKVTWRTGTKVTRDLYYEEEQLESRETGLRDFGINLDKEEDEDKLFGFPTRPGYYKEAVSSLNPF